MGWPRAVLVLAAALLSPHLASASTCWPTEPICQDFFAADAVFVARAVWVGPEPGHVAPGDMVRIIDGDPMHHVRVEILEIFRGLAGVKPGAIIEIRYDLYAGTKPGEISFVYAKKQEDGGLLVVPCGRTKRIDRAAEDLTFARSVATSAATESHVFGETAWGDMQPRVYQLAKQTPLPWATLTVAGERGVQRIDSDAGRFELQLAPGTYEVVVEVPAGFLARVSPSTVHVVDPRACQKLRVVIQFAHGRITGRVVDADGRPLRSATTRIMADTEGRGFELVPIGPPPSVAADGSFVEEDAEPGRHMLTIVPWPGASPIERVIDLKPGEALDLGAIVVPRASREPARPPSVP